MRRRAHVQATTVAAGVADERGARARTRDKEAGNRMPSPPHRPPPPTTQNASHYVADVPPLRSAGTLRRAPAHTAHTAGRTATGCPTAQKRLLLPFSKPRSATQLPHAWRPCCRRRPPPPARRRRKRPRRQPRGPLRVGPRRGPAPTPPWVTARRLPHCESSTSAHLRLPRAVRAHAPSPPPFLAPYHFSGRHRLVLAGLLRVFV